LRPIRQWDDRVALVKFKGLKTGKEMVRWVGTSPEMTEQEANTASLRQLHLLNDLDRLISIEIRTRKEWHEKGADVKPAGTMVLK